MSNAKIYLNPQGENKGNAKDSPHIEIITYNNSDENMYVEKLLVNGQEYSSPMIDRSVLIGQFPVGTDMNKVDLKDPKRDPLKNPPKGSKVCYFLKILSRI